MIRFCTPVKSHMGYAEMGRSVVSQLVRAGEKLVIEPIKMEESDCNFGVRGALLDSMVGKARPGVTRTNIVNMIPPLFQNFRLPGVKNIGFTTFEADKIPASWVAQCNAMDAIWVTSKWNAEVFKSSGVNVPISVVGADADISPVAYTPRSDGVFRFLSSFQWSARKNPEGLLRAFCAAFDGRTDVELIIKTHKNPRQAATIEQAINSILVNIKCNKAPTIKVIPEFLDKDKLDQLHASANCFVSLAHAEGWGLPAWQASVMGCPVIHTGYSAPMDYLLSLGAVKYNLTPIFGMSAFVPFFDSTMRWAEPHLDHTIDLMRQAVSSHEDWKKKSAEHAQLLRTTYSEEALSLQVKNAL